MDRPEVGPCWPAPPFAAPPPAAVPPLPPAPGTGEAFPLNPPPPPPAVIVIGVTGVLTVFSSVALEGKPGSPSSLRNVPPPTPPVPTVPVMMADGLITPSDIEFRAPPPPPPPLLCAGTGPLNPDPPPPLPAHISTVTAIAPPGLVEVNGPGPNSYTSKPYSLMISSNVLGIALFISHAKRRRSLSSIFGPDRKRKRFRRRVRRAVIACPESSHQCG